MKILITFIKYVSTFAAFIAVVLLSSMTIGAQTEKEFSVPCVKALRIGLSGVEKLHSKDMERRTKGNSDSDTELLEKQGALKNYLSCRRADTAKKLKKLTADERKQINLKGENARQLARMRVDLIYGVSFDEKFEDPVNYVISQNAIVLVEDYKGNLTGVYKPTKNANADERQLEGLLARIEKIAREHDEAAEFAAFKTAVEETLQKSADGKEKAATNAFLFRLLKMNLADEN